jgi:acetylornithine deacetylase/succinyl-diaminopimelate desuccinylase-like protein
MDSGTAESATLTDQARAKATAIVRAHADDQIALTEELVAAPSENLPGDETRPAAVIEKWLPRLGLPDAVTLGAFPHRPNLLITIDSGQPGPRLGLCGHLDTKPVGDAAAEWKSDPFTATTIDGRMYGLGTTDMKGAVAAMLVAGAAFEQVKSLVGGSLTLILTADEEYGSIYGAQYLVEQGSLDVDGIVLGEPSGVHEDWEAIRVVSRGISCFKVRVFGDQIHSSISDQFPVVNAVDHMARLYCGFRERFRPAFPDHPLCAAGPTLNVGVKTVGGVGFGVNAGVAEFWSDVRTTPGMEQESFDRDVRSALAAAAADIPGIRYEVEYPPNLTWIEPTEVAEGHPLTVACRDAGRRVLGREIPLATFPGASDAYPFQHLGGIPTIASFGPGWLTPAHGPNEWVSISSLHEAADIYAQLAITYCLGEPVAT